MLLGRLNSTTGQIYHPRAQTMSIVIAIFFFALLFAAISLLVTALRNGIGPMPSSPRVVRALLGMIPAELEGTIVELGAGWGSLLFPLAKALPRCQVIGYENSLVPFLFCSLLQKLLFHAPNLQLIRGDFFQRPLHNTSLVVCYLYPGAMRKLHDKFEAELPDGALVISHTFAVPGWTPKQVIELNDLYRTKIYLYSFTDKNPAIPASRPPNKS